MFSRCTGVVVLAALLPAVGVPRQVYAAPGDLNRVSVSSGEVQADDMSYSGEISSNGRYVAFDSEAGNLVTGDANGVADVFLRDLQLGTTVLVSTDASGAQGNQGSGEADVSADGRFVVFSSWANNLIAGDTNGVVDVFVKDMQTGGITRVSLGTGGVQADADSSPLSISGDGRYVLFTSEAGNLVPNDVNALGDIFLHDRQTGITISPSINSNASFGGASISLDGRFIVFTSTANYLVSGDTNEKRDIFVYEIQTGQITRVSVNSSGIQADQHSFEPSISGDGRYVTFSSSAENLMTEDTMLFTYVYVHDRVTGTTTPVSFKNGYPMYGWADSSIISADGRYIAFSYDDKGDGMAVRWIYVHDRVSNLTVLPTQGSDTNAPILPSISGDGRLLVYASSGPLVSDDTNGVRDIFVKEVAYPPDLNPTVKSTEQGCPNGCSGSADQVVDFLVEFSEPVTGVDAGDFVLTIGGGISGAAITAVSGSGSDYEVQVNTGSGDGTLRLDVVDNDSIKDFPLNPLGGVGAGNGNFTAGAVYIVDKNIVSVTNILRADPNPSSSGSVRFAVNFSEPVTGVDTGDFSAIAGGSIVGAAVIEVTGSGNSYLVTVNSGAGDGALRLDLIDNNSIVDLVSVPLGGWGTNDFTAGETYTIDKSFAVVSSILRADVNPTSADAVRFNVTFSETVSGVDAADFSVAAAGPAGASILTVSGSGNSYAVTVGTGTGNGTLRLDLIDNDSILDSFNTQLAGSGAGNGNYVGETYTINKTPAVIQSTAFRSTGANDGWLLESSEDGNVGGSVNTTAATFVLGDNLQDSQYRAVLHFPTYYLPDNAVVTQAILVIKKQGLTGTDPLTTHQNIQVDICSGLFGFDGTFGSFSLIPSDFQAPATRNAVGTIQNNPVNDRYWSLLDGSAYSLINLVGITQIRLSFQLDDNDDLGDDYISFFSGDATHQLDRPHLMIEYYVPR
jgi:hypothetical protein